MKSDRCVRSLQEEVEKNSAGAVRVDLVYGSSLGNEFERLNQVRSGVIQMCDCNEATIATVYKDTPFFAASMTTFCSAGLSPEKNASLMLIGPNA
jgi:TRAP-type C4-dicarboxylate transport system substrate-binding protein